MSGQNEEEVVVVELEHSAEEIDAAIDDINTAKPQIEQALDDIDDLFSNMAPDYPDGGPYEAGDYCIHEGAFYRAKEAVAQGASWDESKWTLISIGEDLAKKANRDDYCPDMTVGNAEQIVSSIGVTDTDPYNYRTSGGTADIGNRAEEKKLIGGTIAWNQFAELPDAGVSGIFTVTKNGNYIRNELTTEMPASFAIANFSKPNHFDYIVGHKVLVICSITKYSKANTSSDLYLYGIPESATPSSYFTRISQISQAGMYYAIFNVPVSYSTETNRIGLWANNWTVGDYVESTCILTDLTQMFGSTIADYIYSLEQAHAGDGVAWFRQYFPKDYYPCNAGNLMSVLLSRKEITKLNQWDEEWEVGGYDVTTGNPEPYTDRIRTKNPIEVIPNTSYYAKDPTNGNNIRILFYDVSLHYISATSFTMGIFTTPSNCRYIKFFTSGSYGNVYKNDICVHLHWDGSRDGEYEPYELIPYPLPNVELRGIWKLDANNKLYFDGDELTPSGSDNLKRKWGITDMASQRWFYNEPNSVFYCMLADGKAKNAYGTYSGICAAYPTNIKTSFSSMPDKTIDIGSGFASGASCSVVVKDSAYTTVEAFTAAVSGKYLIYELAQPTLETAGDYTAIQTVDDFGTEEFVDTREVAIPVGHETMYQANVGGFAESMYARGNGSPEEFVIQEELEQGLSNKASIEDLEKGNLVPLLSEKWTPYSDESGAKQTEPFFFQATATANNTAETPTPSPFYLNGLRGNTVVYNQFSDIPDGQRSSAGNQVGTKAVEYISNHMYFFCVYAKFGTTPSTEGGSAYASHPVLLGFFNTAMTNYKRFEFAYKSSGNYVAVATGSSLYGSLDTSSNNRIVLQLFPNSNDTVTYANIKVIDLTRWFNGNIPQAILDDPTVFPINYYDGELTYSAGELKNCSCTELNTVGFNQLKVQPASFSTPPTHIDISNATRVFPNTNYCLAYTATGSGRIYIASYDKNGDIIAEKNVVAPLSPSLWYYSDSFKVTMYGMDVNYPTQIITFLKPAYIVVYKSNFTSLTDCNLNLSWDGERDGTYEPYTSHTYPMVWSGKSAGSAYDEKLPDGTDIVRIGSVDLGTLNWIYTDNGGIWPRKVFVATLLGKANGFKMVCSAYSTSYFTFDKDKTIFGTDNNAIYVRDDSFTDAATFKAAMDGVILYYELATPTTSSGDAFTSVIEGDDYGTMEFDSVVPVGNEFFYPADYKGMVDDLYNYTGGDASALALKSDVPQKQDMYLVHFIIDKSQSPSARVRGTAIMKYSGNDPTSFFYNSGDGMLWDDFLNALPGLESTGYSQTPLFDVTANLTRAVNDGWKSSSYVRIQNRTTMHFQFADGEGSLTIDPSSQSYYRIFINYFVKIS